MTGLVNVPRPCTITETDSPGLSHLFGVRKPNEAIYRCFEKATGTAPAEILFFDDRPENVQAACDYGWHAAQVHRERPAAEQIREVLGEHSIVVKVTCD